jgi:hypothetical protein
MAKLRFFLSFIALVILIVVIPIYLYLPLVIYWGYRVYNSPKKRGASRIEKLRPILQMMGMMLLFVVFLQWVNLGYMN